MVDTILEAVERGAARLISERGLRARRFGKSDAAAMTRQEDVPLGLGFFQLLLQFQQRTLQRFDLDFLIVYLFAVALRETL